MLSDFGTSLRIVKKFSLLCSEILSQLFGHKIKHRNKIVVLFCGRAVYIAHFSSLGDLQNIPGINFSHIEELSDVLL